MILALTLAGILTTQPVDRVYLTPSWFAYVVAGVEHDCPNARVSLTGSQATVTAQVCTIGVFSNGFEETQN